MTNVTNTCTKSDFDNNLLLKTLFSFRAVTTETNHHDHLVTTKGYDEFKPKTHNKQVATTKGDHRN